MTPHTSLKLLTGTSACLYMGLHITRQYMGISVFRGLSDPELQSS